MPYQWHEKEAMGWRIDEGESRFLIAEGSGYSRQIGAALFVLLSGKPPPSETVSVHNTNRDTSP